MKNLFLKTIAVLSAIAIGSSGVTTDLSAKTKQSKKETEEIVVSLAGDCTLGVDSRYNNKFNETYAANGSAYFLQNVKKVFEKDDLTLVNLEGPLTESTNRQNKTFTFKGPAAYTGILLDGSVEAVNLANNHTYDFGAQGFSDTKKALKDAKIKYSGYSKIAYKKVKGIRIAMIGFNALSGTTSQTVADSIKTARDKGAQIVITSFHWGIERQYTPTASQQNLAKAAIDSGSDLVVGHHPHVIQGFQKYKGKYIIYSLGNFCFGGNSNPSDKDTMIVQATFVKKSDKKVKSATLKVIPCSLSSHSTYNDFQPKILKGSAKQSIISKLNTRSQAFGIEVSSTGELNK